MWRQSQDWPSLLSHHVLAPCAHPPSPTSWSYCLWSRVPNHQAECFWHQVCHCLASFVSQTSGGQHLLRKQCLHHFERPLASSSSIWMTLQRWPNVHLHQTLQRCMNQMNWSRGLSFRGFYLGCISWWVPITNLWTWTEKKFFPPFDWSDLIDLSTPRIRQEILPLTCRHADLSVLEIVKSLALFLAGPKAARWRDVLYTLTSLSWLK